jgi:hypothetical protein
MHFNHYLRLVTAEDEEQAHLGHFALTKPHYYDGLTIATQAPNDVEDGSNPYLVKLNRLASKTFEKQQKDDKK